VCGALADTAAVICPSLAVVGGRGAERPARPTAINRPGGPRAGSNPADLLDRLCLPRRGRPLGAATPPDDSMESRS
jgi:hypothetical protein